MLYLFTLLRFIKFIKLLSTLCGTCMKHFLKEENNEGIYIVLHFSPGGFYTGHVCCGPSMGPNVPGAPAALVSHTILSNYCFVYY